MRPVTAALRRQLFRERAFLAPAGRRRRPRVVALRIVATTPRFVVATAMVEDGGLTAYRVRFTLQRLAGRWVVSGVVAG